MNSQVFKLPENLDLTFAAPLRAHLAALLGQPLTIDASNVQRLGGLCMQVLLAAGIAWGQHGDELRVLNPSDTFISSMKQMGIDDFGAWIQERAAV